MVVWTRFSSRPNERWTMRPFPLFLATGVALACAVDTTAPPSQLTLQPAFTNQAPPAELPNVFRYSGEGAFGVADAETDLFALAGFPDDPTQITDCGGPGAAFNTFYVQEAGQLRNVIHQIVKGDNVNIHVYRFSTFVDPCTSKPIARGTGSLLYHDSDVLVTGNGTDSYGVGIYGTVALTNGQTAKLWARNLWHVYPDGTVRRIFRRVTMNVM
jgi:hypothetical protein